MLLALLLLPTAAQALAMFVDERVYHRRRGLPRWERIGHPLDTLTVAACYAWLLVAAPGDRVALGVYAALALGSCLFVTKDEPVHARLCEPREQWLHAVLFVLHPIVLGAWGAIWWWQLAPVAIAVQLGLTLAFLVYQVVYWSWSPDGRRRQLDLRPAR